jgi:hypothetical protein
MYAIREIIVFPQLQDGGREAEAGEPLHSHGAYHQTQPGQARNYLLLV